jgi:hypothetical protein
MARIRDNSTLSFLRLVLVNSSCISLFNTSWLKEVVRISIPFLSLYISENTLNGVLNSPSTYL